MNIKYRTAKTEDVARCIAIRGMTRQNPMSVEDLQQFGVTEHSWKSNMEQQHTIGVVLEHDDQIIGFCFGDTSTGEVQSLALLPEYEGHGYGKALLLQLMEQLFSQGFEKLWLAASPHAEIRAHGFYRHLGWTATGKKDAHGDELLVYVKS
ncbi:MAG: GNAT family N-acetyltransferase [Bacteroidota bacterium]